MVAYAHHGALVFHDRFQVKGGGERVAADFAAVLDAAVVTEYWDRQASYPAEQMPRSILTLGRKVKLRGMWFLAPCFRFWSFSRKIEARDLIIFSGSACLAAAGRQKAALKILYCYSPPRFAFDQCAFLLSRQHPLVRPFSRVFAAAVRAWYQRRLDEVDLILCVSKTIQDRLLRLCGRESELLYPGIDIPEAEPAPGEYYLSFARIDPLKRIERIVQAFLAMPDKKLVIASSGSREAEVRALAAGASNIEVLGSLSDQELHEAIRRSIAAIYIPIAEDFGLTPLEAAAFGKPTIGVAEGGLVETIVDGETGILLDPAFSDEDLRAAVRALDESRAEAMRPACLAQARRFDKAAVARRPADMVAPGTAARTAPGG